MKIILEIKLMIPVPIIIVLHNMYVIFIFDWLLKYYVPLF